ncbi:MULTISPECIES: class I SAM-dependent methyltransferase [Nocardiopsis]|uniref:16S rRNA (Guanine1207-N2)-methyltransferase n=1 Tax=Nocardiopsis sinuspersici TaxID=501010 RepID=A0A1V3C066_9ACTN|nr:MULTISPECIES: methyltransferase [Nocardiopsis]NYH55390.1 16S rRNA (guanine1207-N2)-methyltransferase [Nocardiopsis sinuspersici]OOC54032.1 MFS transporter [Nocardiopsis sinuspersici]
MAQHYFDSDPGAASRPSTADLVLPDLHLRLRTDRGVFSPDKVDLGTRVLLETVPAPPDQGRLLDLGCGYGPIALTMASRAPRAHVLGVDVNTRAVDLARRNAAEHGLDNARFAAVGPEGAPNAAAEDGGDDTAAPTAQDLLGPFDAVWSNPPIRVGKDVLHAMLRTWLGRLTPQGVAHLVVQRHLGSDSLQKWLDSQGLPAERVASRAGFRVLAVRRSLP